MKIACTFIFILFSSSIVCGQTQSMDVGVAEGHFSNKRFGAVASYYEELLKTDPSNPDINFKMGVCYLNSRSQKEKAFEYFKKAMSGNSPENSESEITYKLLADACYQASNYDEAIINYEKHEKSLSSKKTISRSESEEMAQKIEMCKMAKELKELKALVTAMTDMQNLSREKHKASCSDTSCSTGLAAPSSLLLSNQTKLEGKNFEDKYFSERDLNTESHFKRDSTRLDTSSCLKEATVASSADGQIILIYSTEKEEGNVYASGLNGNKWTTPEKLCKAINNKSWEPNEFISADGNTLYFSSAREGGFGGKDIYKCTKLANGDWSKAINLGPDINSAYDEVAPFVHPDLTTLYFSSNRFKADKGYDVFTSTFADSGMWRKPLMVGYRIHKAGEYAFKGKGSASEKPEVKEEKTEVKKEEEEKKKEEEKKEKENYLVTFAEQKKVPMTMIKGKVVDKDGKIPDYVEITVTNNETGEILGIYNADSKTGKYAFILPPQKNNNITFEADGYLYHSENIDISEKTEPYVAHNVVELVPLANDSKDVLNNLFFEDKKAELTKDSHVELDRLYNFLSEKRTVAIEISTCISKDCSPDDNSLAENKVQAITNYLMEKGIAKDRLSTKVYKRSKREEKKNRDNSNSEKLEIKIINI